MSYLHMKFEEFTQKFKDLFAYKKKVKGLENYISVAPLPVDFVVSSTKKIALLKEIMNDSFLDEEDVNWLKHRIEKLDIDALTWSHKTKWLKKEMRRMVSIHEEGQMEMDFGYAKPPVNIPTHLLTNPRTQSSIGAR